MSTNLEDALQELAVDAAREVTEQWRGATLGQIQGASQGADGLEPYLSEVQEGDEEGVFTFEIQHPTASLHERGGHIEPTYAEAMVLGWDRDGFYEALTDCNEFVRRKKLVRNARDDLKVM